MENPIATRATVPTTREAQLDYILVDGSSSMSPKWWNFIAAADVIVDSVRQAGINSHLIVHVFDSHDLEMIQRDGPIAQCPNFNDEPLRSHFGATPLYDAINLMANKLKALDPLKASILVVTDGDDTSSKTTVTDARALLDWCRAKGWQVTFIGCDFNNSHQAQLLGVNEANAIGVQRKMLTDAAKAFGRKRAAYGHSGDDIEFSDSEKKQFGGYLTSSNGNG